MRYIKLQLPNGASVRFTLYEKEAPATCDAFIQALPLEVEGIQARFAGEEIWIPDGPSLEIPQENATIELKVGELGYAPTLARSSVSRSIALVYGEAKLSDCVNVFAIAVDKDLEKLKEFGERVWLQGKQTLRFEIAED